MTRRYIRIGQIVPSSNTTMETEIPAMLRARETIAPERFTFHSSRMRMKNVTKEELAAMDAESTRCAAELADAETDVIGYACLVAIMTMGLGYHRDSESRLEAVAKDSYPAAKVVTSAGALVEGLRALGAKRVSMITPYLKPLTRLVVDYVENEGLQVVDAVSLEISNNVQVGDRDPLALVDVFENLTVRNIDAIVLSACVQMPSLEAIPIVESKAGLPVISAATCTTYAMLRRLGLSAKVPDAGALLSGAFN